MQKAHDICFVHNRYEQLYRILVTPAPDLLTARTALSYLTLVAKHELSHPCCDHHPSGPFHNLHFMNIGNGLDGYETCISRGDCICNTNTGTFYVIAAISPVFLQEALSSYSNQGISLGEHLFMINDTSYSFFKENMLTQGEKENPFLTFTACHACIASLMYKNFRKSSICIECIRPEYRSNMQSLPQLVFPVIEEYGVVFRTKNAASTIDTPL